MPPGLIPKMQFKSQLIPSILCCVGLHLQAAPVWWSDSDYQLIDSAKTASDNALVVQGQAKQAFAASKSYFDDVFIQFDGAGEDIDTLFESSWFTTPTYDYTVLLNGQLKSLAHPFYKRLDELGIPLSLVGFEAGYNEPFPWTEDDLSDDVDYAPALIGQVKHVFSFDLDLSQDGDSIPDWWEYVFGTDPEVDTDNSATDSDGDSRTDSTEYAEKTDPTDYYDGALPTLTIVSGDNQQVTADSPTADPIVVRVDKNSVLLSNAPIEISLDPLGSGAFSVGEDSTGSSLSARTDENGEISVAYNAASDFEGSATIDFLARSASNEISIQAILTVLRELSFSLFSGRNQTYVYNGIATSATGRNDSGQLPGHTDRVVDQFSKLSGLPNAIAKMTAGEDHVLALTTNGLVYAWGDNFFGQLGLGDFQGRDTPTLIAALDNVIDIAAGDGFSSFLVDDGAGETTVYLSGNLKDGLKTGSELSNLPIAAGQTSHPGVNQLSASARHLLVLCVDGSVWGWGQNQFGQINPASTAHYLSEATQVIDAGISAIETSPDNSLAISSDGALTAWGNTAFDQLASGTLDPETGIYTFNEKVTHAASGNGVIAYLDISGALMTAGLNDSWQLGRSTGDQIIASAAAVTLPKVDAITSIASGDRHFVYLTEADEIYGFGDNSQGALGMDAIERIDSPTLLTPNFD